MPRLRRRRRAGDVGKRFGASRLRIIDLTFALEPGFEADGEVELPAAALT